MITNSPKINGSLEFDANGNLLFNGKKIFFKRVHGKDPRRKKEFNKCIGIIVALDKDCFGCSKVHYPLDKFDKNMGLVIAIGRAQSGRPIKKLPLGFREDFEKMKERAAAYFKS